MHQKQPPKTLKTAQVGRDLARLDKEEGEKKEKGAWAALDGQVACYTFGEEIIISFVMSPMRGR